MAGNTNPGNSDGVGPAATFFSPSGVSIDGEGNIIVADRDNQRIRMISPGGKVTTIAGNDGGVLIKMVSALQFIFTVQLRWLLMKVEMSLFRTLQTTAFERSPCS